MHVFIDSFDKSDKYTKGIILGLFHMKFKLFLTESKAAQDQAVAILRRKNIKNYEEAFQKIKGMFDKRNMKFLPVAAFFYQPDRINFEYIIKDFLSVAHLLNVNVTKEKVKIKYKGEEYVFEQTDNSWKEFEYFIHAIQSETQEKTKLEKVKRGGRNAGKLIIKKNGIEIRLARNIWDSIALGKETPFCISQPGTPHFNVYRIKEGYTIYFIFDDNFPATHELHIVVYMIDEGGRVLLTDLENTTGYIQNPYEDKKDRGDHTEKYKQYLKEHEIDVENLFVHVPLSEEENKIVKRFSEPIGSLDGFKRLSAKDKLNYLTMGHRLADEQVEYLVKWVKKHPYDYNHIKVLHHYFYSGYPVKKELIPYLKEMKFDKTNLLKHYLKYRKEKHNYIVGINILQRAFDDEELTPYEYELLPEKEKSDVWLTGVLIEKAIGEKFKLNKVKEIIKNSRGIVVEPYLIKVLNKYSARDQIALYRYIRLSKDIIQNNISFLEDYEVIMEWFRQLGKEKIVMDDYIMRMLLKHFTIREIAQIIINHFVVDHNLIYYINRLETGIQKELYSHIVRRRNLSSSLNRVEDPDVIMFLLKEMEKMGQSIIVDDYFASNIIDFPLYIRKKILDITPFIELSLNSGCSHLCELICQTIDKDNLSRYVADKVFIREYKNADTLDKLIAFVEICHHCLDEQSMEKVVHDIVKLLKNSNREQVELLNRIISRYFLSEKAFLELVSLEHPAVELAIFNRIIDYYVLDDIPEPVAARVLNKYKDKITKYHIESLIRAWKDGKFKNIEKWIIPLALQNARLACSIIIKHYSASEGLLNHLALEEHAYQLYQVTKKLFLEKFHNCYSSILAYYGKQGRYDVIDRMYFPWDFDASSQTQIAEYASNNFFYIKYAQYPKLHQWALKVAIPIDHVATQKFDYVYKILCHKILESVNDLSVSVKDLASFVVKFIRFAGMNDKYLQLIRPYRHKRELFELIRISGHLSEEEINYLHQLWF